AYGPQRFADHCNDRRLTEGQLLRRASVKREPCGSPTTNGCANLAPLWFCRYFTDNDTLNGSQPQNPRCVSWKIHDTLRAPERSAVYEAQTPGISNAPQ